MIYYIMAGAFFICTVAWAMVLRANRTSPMLYRVHYVMLALMCAKTLSLLLRGVDYHYIKMTGHENKEWAFLFYTVHLAKGLMLFTVILLIGAGFGFIKHALSKNERMIFLIVIPLQVVFAPDSALARVPDLIHRCSSSPASLGSSSKSRLREAMFVARGRRSA